jgi:hypothetical protein
MRAPATSLENPMPIPFVLAALLTAAAPDPMSAPIVAAENAFSADARRYGTRLAFLAHFDAGSWLFRPYPVDALAALARDADDGAPLEWSPDTVGVSASGDMGFTSGPWSAHAAGTDELVHGHFLTVWKRGDDGIWRVQVDAGIGHPALAKPAAEVDIVVRGADAPAKALANDDAARRRAALEKSVDDLRNALGAETGDRTALWQRTAHADIRVLRSGHAPATGDDAHDLLAHDAARAGSGPRRALDVASSGDLAYTLGGDASCAACGAYYRIWRWQDGAWRVLVDLTRATAR